MNSTYFHPRRRLADSIVVINGKTNGVLNVSLDSNNNALRGHSYYKTTKYGGGLNDIGIIEYSIVFDNRFANSDMVYNIVEFIPSISNGSVSLSSLENEITIVRFRRDVLAFVDVIRIGVGVRSPCLLDRELGRVYYAFNVSSTYDLYHSYNNTLVSSDEKHWSSGGWLSEASVVWYPQMNITVNANVKHLDVPCYNSRIESSLDVLNTSQHTYWDHGTRSYKTSNMFVGDKVRSIPRCHRRHAGSVCVVLAKVRLYFGQCQRPVMFSVRQAVSHISRMSSQFYSTDIKPDNFDAERRSPVPDGLDMRYDMCEARVCQSPHNCHAFHIENDGLKHDGGIYINQYDSRTTRYIESVCTFEVIGFLDNIWTPHVYFRQWVGFNWTMIKNQQ